MVIGSIYMFAGATAPEGFLICDGSAVSRTNYSDLFDTIGTAYGVGDGSTTFNIPNLSGRVALGSSATHALGSTGGEEAHSLVESEIPSHDHEVPSHSHENTIQATTPSLSHTVTQPAYNYAGPNGTRSIYQSGVYARTGQSSVNASRSKDLAVAKHDAAACTMSGGITDCASFDTETAGTSASHNNMQPFVTMNYIIYAGV